MAQRHQLFYEVKMSEADSGGDWSLMGLLDWVVAVGCANHDVQNALKWSLYSLSEEGEVIKKMYTVIVALRNGFDLLHARLASFVTAHLRLEEAPFDVGEVYSFWINIGVDPDVAQILADLNLQWKDDHLVVNARPTTVSIGRSTPRFGR